MGDYRDSALLRLALPSKGHLHEPTLELLRGCGAQIATPDDRHYEISVRGYAMTAVFQRARDITDKIRTGSADAGITGIDMFLEAKIEDEPLIVVAHPALGYGRCNLEVAVPDGWLDTDSMEDLAELAYEWKETKDVIRIATEFPHLTRRFFMKHRVHYFKLVPATGAVEAAPRMDSADVVCTLVESGTSLRDNHLKRLRDGVVRKSQACLLANRDNLRKNGAKRETLRVLLQTIESYLHAKGYVSITANIAAQEGENEAAVAARMDEQLGNANHELLGRTGPTVSYVYRHPRKDDPPDESRLQYFAVNVVVPAARKAETIDLLRTFEGSAILVQHVDYIFERESACWTAVEKALAERPRRARGSGDRKKAPRT